MSHNESRITVETKVYPTERRERVEKAVLNLFPETEFEYKEDDTELKLTGRTSSTARLSELVDEQDINETTRDHLLDCIVGDTVVFRLSKQPAFVGRVNFDVGGHELGSVLVRVEADRPVEFVRRLTTPG